MHKRDIGQREDAGHLVNRLMIDENDVGEASFFRRMLEAAALDAATYQNDADFRVCRQEDLGRVKQDF